MMQGEVPSRHKLCQGQILLSSNIVCQGTRHYVTDITNLIVFSKEKNSSFQFNIYLMIVIFDFKISQAWQFKVILLENTIPKTFGISPLMVRRKKVHR